MVIEKKEDIPACIERLTGQCGGTSDSLYVEKWFPYVKELAVMVVCGINGEIKSYPVVETIQTNNICHMVLAPANVSKEVTEVNLLLLFIIQRIFNQFSTKKRWIKLLEICLKKQSKRLIVQEYSASNCF